MNMIYGLVGAGGHGRDVMPLLQHMLKDELTAGISNIFFVIEGEDLPLEINGYPVISLETFCNLPNAKRFNVAIANSAVRERIANICLAAGASPFSIHANNICLMEDEGIGEGAMLSPFVTITTNVKIGRFFHANMYSYVAHDCVIGDFVTFAPAVKCNGNIVIENHAYIGSGAVIKQGKMGNPLVIGQGAIIGMGAVVTKNVPPGTIVIGNPARPLTKDILKI